MIASYPDLRQQIMNKTRGRKHEVLISTGPDLWTYMLHGFDGDVHVVLDSTRQTVCTVYPDNSLEIDIHGWHSQLSCRIIELLTGHSAWSHHSNLWHYSHPVDGPIRYDCKREFVRPPKYVAIGTKADELMEQITLADLPPKYRLLKELGQWDPAPAISGAVKAYASGEMEKAGLSARDILTIVKVPGNVITRLFEEAI